MRCNNLDLWKRWYDSSSSILSGPYLLPLEDVTSDLRVLKVTALPGGIPFWDIGPTGQNQRNLIPHLPDLWWRSGCLSERAYPKRNSSQPLPWTDFWGITPGSIMQNVSFRHTNGFLNPSKIRPLGTERSGYALEERELDRYRQWIVLLLKRTKLLLQHE